MVERKAAVMVMATINLLLLTTNKRAYVHYLTWLTGLDGGGTE